MSNLKNLEKRMITGWLAPDADAATEVETCLYCGAIEEMDHGPNCEATRDGRPIEWQTIRKIGKHGDVSNLCWVMCEWYEDRRNEMVLGTGENLGLIALARRA